MNSIKILCVGLMVLFAVGCGFTKEVRQASATVVPLATYQLTVSNISIEWLIEVLETHKTNQIREFMARNPEADPENITVMINMDNADGTTEEVPIEEVIDNLNEIVKTNKETARLLDTLNESVQANQGWNPIAGEIDNLIRDPEFQALVKAYAELLRNKSQEE